MLARFPIEIPIGLAAIVGVVAALLVTRWRHDVVRELRAIRELLERFFGNGNNHP